MSSASQRARRRPATRGGRPVLTRESLAEAALRLAGEEGFPALTMRRLADEVGVTVRALYRHVRDRQEVVDLTAQLMLGELPEHRLDPEDWRACVREMYFESRALFRQWPRATLVSLDEQVTVSGVHPSRIISPERMLAFFRQIGLSLPDALATRTQMLVDVFGFVLLIDYRYDRVGPEIRRAMQSPVPEPWLDAHPELDVPNLREALTVPEATSDDAFENVVANAVAAIEKRIERATG